MRYVILHHTGWVEDHFDLMLEVDADGALETWRLDGFPAAESITPLPAHRRAYLEYEGPVSRNRGHVRRVAAGQYATVARTDAALIIRLDDGQQLTLPLERPPAQ